MPPKLSAAAAAVAAARREAASESTGRFLDFFVQIGKLNAIVRIDYLLEQMQLVAIDNHIEGYSLDHLEEAKYAFAHMKLCLGLPGPLAPIAAEAVDAIWHEVCDDNCTHEEFFRAAGMDEQFKDCMRVIHDAVATSMIGDPETLEHVMQMTTLQLNTKSKLRHAYCINRTHYHDVGHHLTTIW